MGVDGCEGRHSCETRRRCAAVGIAVVVAVTSSEAGADGHHKQVIHSIDEVSRRERDCPKERATPHSCSCHRLYKYFHDPRSTAHTPVTRLLHRIEKRFRIPFRRRPTAGIPGLRCRWRHYTHRHRRSGQTPHGKPTPSHDRSHKHVLGTAHGPQRGQHGTRGWRGRKHHTYRERERDTHTHIYTDTCVSETRTEGQPVNILLETAPEPMDGGDRLPASMLGGDRTCGRCGGGPIDCSACMHQNMPFHPSHKGLQWNIRTHATHRQTCTSQAHSRVPDVRSSKSLR